MDGLQKSNVTPEDAAAARPLPAVRPDGPVPAYALYGETREDPVLDLMHCESIPARSRLHDWRIRPHRHPGLFQMLYMRRGSAAAEVDGRALRLVAPVVVSMPAAAVHGYAFSRDADGWVVTMPDAAMRGIVADVVGLAACLEVPRVVELRADDGAAFERLVAGVAEEFGRHGADRGCAIRGYLALILVQLGRAVQAGGEAGPAPSNRRAVHLRRFRAAVERDFRDGRSIRDYAAELGLTPVHLNRLCREALGRSALQVVHDRRLLEAKRQLLYTSMTVTEIAYALGYASPAYFSRFFAHRVGRPPSAFRAAAQRAAG